MTCEILKLTASRQQCLSCLMQILCEGCALLERRLSRVTLPGNLLKLPSISGYELSQLGCHLFHLRIGRSTRARRSWTGSSAHGSAIWLQPGLRLVTKASCQVGSKNTTGKVQQPAGSRRCLFGCWTTSLSSSSGASKIARALVLNGLF